MMNSKNTAGRLTISKVIVTTAYCALVCAAITFSFKSLFFTLAANTVNEMEVEHGDSASRATLSKTGSGTGLESGEIMKIQKSLNDLGYEAGNADGIFGVKTQEALMKFQRAMGIDEDKSGLPGKQTLEALGIFTAHSNDGDRRSSKTLRNAHKE